MFAQDRLFLFIARCRLFYRGPCFLFQFGQILSQNLDSIVKSALLVLLTQRTNLARSRYEKMIISFCSEIAFISIQPRNYLYTETLILGNHSQCGFDYVDSTSHRFVATRHLRSWQKEAAVMCLLKKKPGPVLEPITMFKRAYMVNTLVYCTDFGVNPLTSHWIKQTSFSERTTLFEP